MTGREIVVGRKLLAAALVGNFALAGLNFKIFGSVQDNAYYSYVSPAGPAFGIWSLIYCFNIIFVLGDCFGSPVPGMREARKYQALNFISNGGWLIANNIGNWFGVLVIFINFFSLFKAYQALEVDYYNSSLSVLTKLRTYVPVSMNWAWITVASVLNLSNTLYNPEADATVVIGGPDWAQAVVLLVMLVGAYISFTRLDLAHSFILSWALYWVRYNQGPHRSSPNVGDSKLADTCVVAISVLAACFIVAFVTAPSTEVSKSPLRERLV